MTVFLAWWRSCFCSHKQMPKAIQTLQLYLSCTCKVKLGPSLSFPKYLQAFLDWFLCPAQAMFSWLPSSDNYLQTGSQNWAIMVSVFHTHTYPTAGFSLPVDDGSLSPGLWTSTGCQQELQGLVRNGLMEQWYTLLSVLHKPCPFKKRNSAISGRRNSNKWTPVFHFCKPWDLQGDSTNKPCIPSYSLQMKIKGVQFYF